MGVVTLSAIQSQNSGDGVPTFRTAVDLVEIDVFVTDSAGRFVRDLAASDFEVLEDGRPHEVQSAALIDLPLPRSSPTANSRNSPPPDVGTNTSPVDRIYVIVMDSPSTRRAPAAVGGGTYFVLARRVMRQFVEEWVGPNDLVAVVHTQGTFTDSQPFTADKRLLFASIDRYGVGISGDRPSGSIETVQIEEQVTRQLATYRTLQDVAQRLGALSGRRKTIVWVGAQLIFARPDDKTLPEVCKDGNPRDCRYIRTAYANLETAHRDAIQVATRNNVVIHAVDPTGLTTDLGTPELDRRSALQTVANDTGGLSVIGTNDFMAGFERIVRDSSTYYVVGYVPERSRRDGKFHDVQVRVKRAGLTTRARKRYVAPASDRDRDLAMTSGDLGAATRDALKAPISIGGLGVDLSTAVFAGDGRNSSVVLVGRLHGPLRFDGNAELAFGYQVFSKDGRVKAGEQKGLKLNLSAASLARAKATGLHFVHRVTLPPGAYEVRFAANQPGGATGSIVVPLEVPAFEVPVAFSSLTLTTGSSSSQLMLLDDKALSAALGGPATSIRRFRQADTLAGYIEVYSNGARAAARDLSLRARLVDAAGTEVRTETLRSATQSPSSDGREPFVFRVSLSGLPTGNYVLVVEGTRTGRDTDQLLTRQVPFEITD